jgi:NADH dehydrogenase [ubiquinone] 1 alpha subcomplex assembly factor 1
MKYLVILILAMQPFNSITIFDFNKDTDIRGWNIVNDVVMGGRSSSNFMINKDGFGVFSGNISLANNGGFSSVRHEFQPIAVTKEDKISIKLKGDGKNYQIRVKNNSGNSYSYISTFSTSGKWQEIEIPLKDMYPSFRGRKLDRPNFSHDSIEEVVFLIGNKKNETFELVIDKIELKSKKGIH